MTGLSKFLGRGLLVLALGCCAVACGDDDDDKPADDGGAGTGGTGGSGGSKAGTGGSKAGTGGKGGSSGDTGPVDCEDTAKENSGGAKDACISCLCDMKEKETAACTKDCWKLANCVVSDCAGNGMDTNCIVANCADDVGGAANLAAVGALARATPFTACAASCFAPPGDASTDGGN